jgi:hypothetical protein
MIASIQRRAISGALTDFSRRLAMKRYGDIPEERGMYRCEVEITELGSGSRRKVPLTAYRMICFARKKGAETPPPVDVRHFEDGDLMLEARSDEEYRDREAEERRESAFQGLIEDGRNA